jgi:methionyl-tRNA formyltransferase
MKIVYMGTPEFARRPLAALCASKHEVLAVVTGQAKRVGRSKNPSPTAVYQEATRQGLPVLTPASLKDSAFHVHIGSLKPDLIVVVAFRILPPELYSLPKHGAINIHGSLLPKYRGAAPINWALINGEKETGLSSFFLKKQVDTGEILAQQRITIDSDESFDSLYERLSVLAGPFLLRSLDLIEQGDLKPLPQNDEDATPAPKILGDDAMIDFGFPAERVKDFVRGLSTRPGAYTYFRGKKTKLLAARVFSKQDDTLVPGSVIADRKRLLIQCANSAVEVLTILPEGKKPMDGLSFKNGFRPQAGEVFGKITKEADAS